MTCPHCKYKNGYVEGKDGFIEGKKGGFFFTSNSPLERITDGGKNREVKTLYACPNCGKTFINV